MLGIDQIYIGVRGGQRKRGHPKEQSAQAAQAVRKDRDGRNDRNHRQNRENRSNRHDRQGLTFVHLLLRRNNWARFGSVPQMKTPITLHSRGPPKRTDLSATPDASASCSPLSASAYLLEAAEAVNSNSRIRNCAASSRRIARGFNRTRGSVSGP